jgi:hypothetical protein
MARSLDSNRSGGAVVGQDRLLPLFRSQIYNTLDVLDCSIESLMPWISLAILLICRKLTRSLEDEAGNIAMGQETSESFK